MLFWRDAMKESILAQRSRKDFFGITMWRAMQCDELRDDGLWQIPVKIAAVKMNQVYWFCVQRALDILADFSPDALLCF